MPVRFTGRDVMPPYENSSNFSVYHLTRIKESFTTNA